MTMTFKAVLDLDAVFISNLILYLFFPPFWALSLPFYSPNVSSIVPPQCLYTFYSLPWNALSPTLWYGWGFFFPVIQVSALMSPSSESVPWPLFKVELLPPINFFHITAFSSFIILKISFHWLVYFFVYLLVFLRFLEKRKSSVFFTTVSALYDTVSGMYYLFYRISWANE